MKNLRKFVNDLSACFDNRLLSVYIFGAKANSEELNVHQNTDILIITEDFKIGDGPNFFSIIQEWKKLGNPCPVIMTRDEFIGNVSTFAMEYSDLKWNNQLIYGEDLLKYIEVDYFDLKNQCERELRRVIQIIREFYLEYSTSPKEITKFSQAIIRTLMVIFRAMLRSNGVVPSVYKHDVLDQLAQFIEFDKLFFKKMIENKEKTYNYSPGEIRDFCGYLQLQLKNILAKFNEKE